MYRLDHDIEKVKYLREAAAVERMHTMRTIGEYTVGHHSFNMLAMLRLVWPDAPRNLIWAIIEHDIPERLTGDILATAKWAGVVRKDPEFEDKLIAAIVGDSSCLRLGAELKSWLKGLDILEFVFYCRDQISLGNSQMLTAYNRVDAVIRSGKIHLPPPLLDLFYAQVNYSWEMTPDLGETDGR